MFVLSDRELSALDLKKLEIFLENLIVLMNHLQILLMIIKDMKMRIQ